MKCTCRSCENARRYNAVIERGNVDELREIVVELHEELANTQFELNVDETILNGTWPSASEYAERIISKCSARIPQPADRRSQAR